MLKLNKIYTNMIQPGKQFPHIVFSARLLMGTSKEPFSSTSLSNPNHHYLHSKPRQYIVQEVQANTVKICNRCEKEKAQIICSSCTKDSDAVYCFPCDQIIHGIAKFSLHERNNILPSSINSPQGRQTIKQQPYNLIDQPKETECSKVTNQNTMALTSVNINQFWNQVAKHIKASFDELLILLQDKQRQLLLKVEDKKQSEIQKFKRVFSQYQNSIVDSKSSQLFNGFGSGTSLKKSQILEKMETCEANLQQLSHQYSLRISNKKKNMFSDFFDGLKNSIARMSVKVIGEKMSAKPHQPANGDGHLLNKSKVRSPTIKNYANVSPAIKTPKHGKGYFSKSAFTELFEEEERLLKMNHVKTCSNDTDGQNLQRTTNIQIKPSKKDQIMEVQPQLTKVKSEKFIFKEPRASLHFGKYMAFEKKGRK